MENTLHRSGPEKLVEGSKREKDKGQQAPPAFVLQDVRSKDQLGIPRDNGLIEVVKNCFRLLAHVPVVANDRKNGISILHKTGQSHSMKAALISIFLIPLAAGQSPIVPVLEKQIPDLISPLERSGFTVELSEFFDIEEILDEAVRHTATYDLNGTLTVSTLDFLLFKNRAPNTVANFLGYVDRGDYAGMFVHRTVSNFVIQGGGFTVTSTDGGVDFGNVPTQPDIINEFNVSNTMGTLAMAKTGASPDSATSQWFVNTGANSDNLDSQNGGFTVFGRISKATLPQALLVNNPAEFLAANFGGAFNQVPLEIGSTPQTLNLEDFYQMDSVTRVTLPPGQAGTDPSLTYRIASAIGSDSISVSLTGSTLDASFTAPSAGDSKTVVVEAADSVGNIVQDSFVIQTEAVENYESWRESFFSPAEAADGTISGPLALSSQHGIANLLVFAHGLDLQTGPVLKINANPDTNTIVLTLNRRKNIGGTRLISERSYDLINWRDVPATVEVNEESSAVVDLVTMTIAQDDTNFPKAYYRVRISTD